MQALNTQADVDRRLHLQVHATTLTAILEDVDAMNRAVKVIWPCRSAANILSNSRMCAEWFRCASDRSESLVRRFFECLPFSFST